jgi:hypothetical protein
MREPRWRANQPLRQRRPHRQIPRLLHQIRISSYGRQYLPPRSPFSLHHHSINLYHLTRPSPNLSFGKPSPISSLPKHQATSYPFLRKCTTRSPGSDGGCKCLKANYSHMRTLQKGVRREGWELTRREKRFVSRTKADLWKIFPFVFFLMTLEEVLPLMVLYTPWLLPSTTILPSQFLRIKSAEEIKRREALLEVGKELRRTQSEQDLGSPTVRSRGGLPVLAGLSPELVKGLCKALDLGTVAPMFWLQRRLTKRIS